MNKQHLKLTFLTYFLFFQGFQIPASLSEHVVLQNLHQFASEQWL